MLRRVETEERREPPSLLSALGLAESEPVVSAVAQADLETALLPHDHPTWVKDSLSVSTRARELIARLRPIVINILSFWDHRVRGALIGGSRILIDPSGSYRVE